MRALKVVSRTSTLSMWAAGLIGALAMQRFGGVLAMGAAIYLGNTEPNEPHMAYPWLLFAFGTAGIGAGLLLEEKRAIQGAIVTHVFAIGLALLPFVQLVRLWKAT